MKKRRKALAAANKPRGLGLQFWAIVWLLMDRWQPAGWVWGVAGTLAVIVTAAAIVDFFTAEDVEL